MILVVEKLLELMINLSQGEGFDPKIELKSVWLYVMKDLIESIVKKNYCSMLLLKLKFEIQKVLKIDHLNS